MSRLVVQTYKAPQQWRTHPPGVGDFIRGACHLFERLDGTGVELRIDVSQTEFADLIQYDESLFYRGDPLAIAEADEYFEDDQPFEAALRTLRRAHDGILHVCSNMGEWQRARLPKRTRDFVAPFYTFVPEVDAAVHDVIQGRAYRVLAIRCGDRFFDGPTATIDELTRAQIVRILEDHVLRGPDAIVLLSDSATLKSELSERYGLLTLPYRSRHGAFGGAGAVVKDLCVLKGSRFNYHINAWSDWWSGFAHYTSMIFNVPEMNFRAPRFAREDL